MKNEQLKYATIIVAVTILSIAFVLATQNHKEPEKIYINNNKNTISTTQVTALPKPNPTLVIEDIENKEFINYIESINTNQFINNYYIEPIRNSATLELLNDSKEDNDYFSSDDRINKIFFLEPIKIMSKFDFDEVCIHYSDKNIKYIKHNTFNRNFINKYFKLDISTLANEYNYKEFLNMFNTKDIRDKYLNASCNE